MQSGEGHRSLVSKVQFLSKSLSCAESKIRERSRNIMSYCWWFLVNQWEYGKTSHAKAIGGMILAVVSDNMSGKEKAGEVPTTFPWQNVYKDGEEPRAANPCSLDPKAIQMIHCQNIDIEATSKKSG